MDLTIKVVTRDLLYKDNYFILNTKYLLKKIFYENFWIVKSWLVIYENPYV